MPLSTTQSIWRSGGGDTTRQAYCGSMLMTATFFNANVATTSNAVVASGLTSQVILPANAVVTEVTITSPITSGSINIGYTTITGGVSDAAFYANTAAVTSNRVIVVGGVGNGAGLGTVANASVNTVLTISSASSGVGSVAGFVTYFVTDYLFGQENV
jgi:hypothetical protein